MPAPATTAVFLDTVRKSGLIGSEQLDEYLHQSDDLPGVPHQMATMMVRQGLLTHFQARLLLQGRYNNFLFGKYKVLDQLGVGGMGAVYLCEHLLMRRPVAIKILPRDRVGDPNCLQRFYHEARAAAALDHRNIVRAHDIDQQGALHFLVMEFVDGKSLHDVVAEQGPLAPERVSHYLYQAAAGLAHAHERGIIHRDIKPANLLLDRQGTVKILDMGLARFFDRSSGGLTDTLNDNQVLGTADYVSPEQSLNSHGVDGRADIYSLGATAYFLLTGRAPFEEGKNVAQKLLAHQMKQAPGLRTLRPDAPAALITLVDHMMCKRPSERPQSAAEVMAALAPLVASSIPPPSDFEMPRRSELIRLADSSPSILSAPAITSKAPSTAGYRVKPAPATEPLVSPAERATRVGLFDPDNENAEAPWAAANNGQEPMAVAASKPLDTAPLEPAPRTKQPPRPKPGMTAIWVLFVLVLLLLFAAAGILLWLVPKPGL